MKVLCVLAPLLAGLILACLTNYAHASDLSRAVRGLAQPHAANGTSSSVLPYITSPGNVLPDSTLPPASTTHLETSRTTHLASTLSDASLVPTGTGLPDNVTFNIDQAWYGRQLNYAANPGYDPTKHLSVLCETCSLYGKLDVNQGGWNVSADNHNPGFMNVTLANVTNAIKIRIQGGESGSMAFPYLTDNGSSPIPDARIMIPGFGKASLKVQPEFWIEWNFTAPLTIEYSGSMRLPGEHSANLDFKNLSASHWQDGPHSQMVMEGTLLSRSAQVEGGDAHISFGLRTHLNVSFDSVPPGTAAAAGIRLDFPTMQVNTSQAPTVQYEDFCKDSYNHQYPDERTMRNFTDTYPTLVRAYDKTLIGVGADLDVAFPWMTNDTLNHWTMHGNGPLLERCYVWDQIANSMATVDTVLVNIRDSLAENETATVGPDGINTVKGMTAAAMKGAAAATISELPLSLLMGGLAFVGVVFMSSF